MSLLSASLPADLNGTRGRKHDQTKLFPYIRPHHYVLKCENFSPHIETHQIWNSVCWWWVYKPTWTWQRGGNTNRLNFLPHIRPYRCENFSLHIEAYQMSNSPWFSGSLSLENKRGILKLIAYFVSVSAAAWQVRSVAPTNSSTVMASSSGRSHSRVASISFRTPSIRHSRMSLI